MNLKSARAIDAKDVVRMEGNYFVAGSQGKHARRQDWGDPSPPSGGAPCPKGISFRPFVTPFSDVA